MTAEVPRIAPVAAAGHRRGPRQLAAALRRGRGPGPAGVCRRRQRSLESQPGRRESLAAGCRARCGTARCNRADAALYQGGNPLAMTAAEHTTGADSQLVRAVRGMEAYYTNQLARRQSELSQLSGPGMAAMNADWQRELVSLDSSYRQLKQELLHHPQPDAVLTAMNRNLQIRLDILDQQLHLGTRPQTPTPATPGLTCWPTAAARPNEASSMPLLRRQPAGLALCGGLLALLRPAQWPRRRTRPLGSRGRPAWPCSPDARCRAAPRKRCWRRSRNPQAAKPSRRPARRARAAPACKWSSAAA